MPNRDINQYGVAEQISSWQQRGNEGVAARDESAELVLHYADTATERVMGNPLKTDAPPPLTVKDISNIMRPIEMSFVERSSFI